MTTQRKDRRHASRLRTALPASALVLVTGCREAHPQSMLHPAGPGADRVSELWWFLFAVCTAVFLIVLGLLIAAVVVPREERVEKRPGNRFIIVSGIVLPAVVLVGMLVYSLQIALALRGPGPEALTVAVIGHQWWWEVQYPDLNVTTANEIRIPAGQPVRLRLRSADVIHSFWVPSLHPKTDMLPEHETVSWLEAREPGAYRGQCAEFCGVQHARMAFWVVSLPPEEFETWATQQARPAPAPEGERRRRGREVFYREGCSNCHVLRDVLARPEDAPRGTAIGPDLTHLGSRRTLGAGLLANNRGNLAGWVANPQALKPGNRMPRSYLSPDDLHMLVEFLLDAREAGRGGE